LVYVLDKTIYTLAIEIKELKNGKVINLSPMNRLLLIPLVLLVKKLGMG
jgi:hypothetical protein